MFRKRLNVDDLSEYMRRDLASSTADRPRAETSPKATDARAASTC